MREYFKTKVGKKIVVKVVTGKTFFTEVYQRNFVIEVIEVSKATKNQKMIISVRSYDVVPSGYKEADSDKYYGEFETNILESRDKTLKEIICHCDMSFMLNNTVVDDMIQIVS
ncbi:hypothetical protein D3C87_82830 [compost metagenome]